MDGKVWARAIRQGSPNGASALVSQNSSLVLLRPNGSLLWPVACNHCTLSNQLHTNLRCRRIDLYPSCTDEVV